MIAAAVSKMIHTVEVSELFRGWGRVVRENIENSVGSRMDEDAIRQLAQRIEVRDETDRFMKKER